jgi:protein-tyrosine phosphatase
MSTIISDFLYVGSLSDACTPSLLIDHGITHVLNLSLTRVILEPSFEVLHVPLNDSMDENLIGRVDITNNFIEQCRRRGRGRCLVVCKHGRSRSAASESPVVRRRCVVDERRLVCIAVVIAYLMACRGHSLASAYSFVSDRRAFISPNRNYLQQLNEYSSQLTAVSSGSLLFIDQQRK